MPEPVRQRPPRRDVVVRDVSRPTPGLVRVVLGGELEGWDRGGPGGHMKVFVPQDGSDELAMRTYTVRRFEPDPGLLTLEFGLHCDGPATTWARAAQIGDAIKISGMARPGFVPAPSTEWCLFLADHSALPAVAAIAEALPAGITATALIEIPSADDALDLSTAAELDVEWLLERGSPCEQLVAAALELELPAGAGEIWVGCEAGSMRAIRAHMLNELGVGPRALHTRAYWKQNVANHSDHDTGEDE
jgi:NADPH-dependent ferric siderophore reductase